MFPRSQLITSPPPLPGGGGGHSPQMGRGCRWGFKTWPCHKPLGAQKIRPVTIYLTKNVHMQTLLQYCTPRIDPVLLLLCNKTKWKTRNLLRPARTAAGAEIGLGPVINTWASRTHCRWCRDRGPGINIMGRDPGWEALRSNPVINGVARQ